MEYDDTNAPVSGEYCTLYLFRQFRVDATNDGWVTEAGCDGSQCTTWTYSSADPACPPPAQLQTITQQRREMGTQLVPAGKFTPQEVKQCTRPVNPNVRRYVCMVTPDMVPMAVFLKNGLQQRGAPGPTGPVTYDFARGLLLLVGYIVFYGLMAVLALWGLRRDKRSQALHAEQTREAAQVPPRVACGSDVWIFAI